MEEIGLEASLVEELQAGRKLVEVCLAKGRFKQFNIGDKISIRKDIWKHGKIVRSEQDAAFVEIIGLMPFGSLNDVFDQIGYKNIVPSAKNVRQALKLYRKFYSVKEENAYGVVAFELKLFAASKR